MNDGGAFTLRERRQADNAARAADDEINNININPEPSTMNHEMRNEMRAAFCALRVVDEHTVMFEQFAIHISFAFFLLESISTPFPLVFSPSVVALLR